MDETTASALGKLVPTEVLQEARLAFQINAELLPLINVVDLSSRPGLTADFPIHTTVTQYAQTAGNETTDHSTSSIIQPTFATLTVVRKSIRVDVSDLAQQASAGESPSATAGRLMGNARVKAEETECLAQVGTAWTSSVGATNATSITPENVLAGLLTLKVNEANDNLVLAIHPKQEAHLLDDLVVTSSSDSDRSAIGQSAMVDGGLSRKSLFGARVISSMRVGTGTDINDVYLGQLFNGKELGYAVKNIGAPIEIQRDASKALNEVIMNFYSDAGVIRAGAFVLVKSQTY